MRLIRDLKCIASERREVNKWADEEKTCEDSCRQSSEATTETRHAVTRSRPSHILSLDSELVQPLYQRTAQRMPHHLMTGLESIAS